jgi:hypothetical protein
MPQAKSLPKSTGMRPRVRVDRDLQRMVAKGRGQVMADGIMSANDRTPGWGAGAERSSGAV